MSRDNVVCNRSLLKYFKVEAMFTELQSLRAAGTTLSANATPIPTMSLAEVMRNADLLCNCTQVRCALNRKAVLALILTHEQPIVRHAEGGFKKEFALDMEALQVGRGGWKQTTNPCYFLTQECEA